MDLSDSDFSYANRVGMIELNSFLDLVWQVVLMLTKSFLCMLCKATI